MSWKVLITARTMKTVGAPAIAALRAAGCNVVIPEKMGPLPKAELLKAIDGCDAALVSPDPFDAEVLGSVPCQNLKIISRWGVGYDSIDIPSATKQGIVVGFTPGLLDETVADYTFAMLLALARRIPDGHAALSRGVWSLSWGRDVHGKTLGILGCGRIGQAVARRAAGFGMKLIGFDPKPSPDAVKLGITFVSMDELLEQSDFVTLHAALTPQTQGMIGAAQLQRMKKTSYLINAARGAILDEAALVQALKEGWIAGAALDAYIVEPLPADHPFCSTPNLLITPHQASCAYETGEKVSSTAAQAIIDLMHGSSPRFVVDTSVLKSPALRATLIARS